jgi:uncharacterized protein (DUF1697 family)
MQTYISLLRGVNMTGHNSMKMKDLVSLFSDLEFKSPETYIQSGNVIFDAPDELSEEEISIIITKGIRSKFDYEIPAIIRTTSELNFILKANPFLYNEKFDISRVAVVFLTNEVTSAQTDKIKNYDYPPDKFHIASREIYIFCPDGFGKSKLYTNFFEGKMGVTGTARNLKTISSLIEISDRRSI